jgi:protein-S-isoprenylcysteine O-methyltransferase Ste14
MDGFSVCGYLWTAWLAIWLIWAFQSKQTRQRESLGSRLSYTFFVWGAMVLMFFPRRLDPWWHADLLPYSAWMGWLGVAITAIGFCFTFWARFTLGSNWSGSVTIKMDHKLIRSGPYRWVRHPIYTGMIVALAGTALACDQRRAIASVLLLWISFTIKRLKEEQFMRQIFGSQYIEYSRTTGAIFPNPLRRPQS